MNTQFKNIMKAELITKFLPYMNVILSDNLY